ncbi:UDP-glucose 4-epimerase family protein [Aestuariirhabdus litorea]|uniref:NAD-dependent epimerase/dehydratase family protein n=1 Tax=Aestuariirhabdus litorea TaxID=2528527 RepID=A0A3P3VR99_9GAMM|nr:SDR family oxidoreductase [Aestuariirhabdus litorea]RRJ84498.1 NAD-dependent epimerase/dehydratase family protein [Aestuariirhabdus litorea]RWW97723.1 NAD-dependent epimerase/dehydratase family protein [Endozoicomonadaceae bacterium GTF-13]
MRELSNILLTGATGFVGYYLLGQLADRERIKVEVALRSDRDFDHCLSHAVGDFADKTCWSNALTDKQVVIHAAARAHIMKDEAADPLAEYRRVNVAGTLNLARQAAAAGVKRFIFISSIKVNGERTLGNARFTHLDIPAPEDAYGVSKAEAESGLLALAEETGLEVVIIRPPLVYGPGVKANFASLLNLVNKGTPLPFGAITSNRRSLVSVHNLVDLIITCIDHPKAANKIFLVSDDHDLSTAQMIDEMSRALGVSKRNFPLPLWIFDLAGKVLRKEAVVARLTGSLSLDISYTKETLGWTPPQSVASGFKETAISFNEIMGSQ